MKKFFCIFGLLLLSCFLFAQEIVTLNGKDYKNISLSEFSFLNASGQLKLGETFVIDAYHSGMIGADFGLMEKDLSANTLFKIKSFVKFDFETPVRAFVEVTKVDAQYPGIMNETTIIKVDKRLE